MPYGKGAEVMKVERIRGITLAATIVVCSLLIGTFSFTLDAVANDDPMYELTVTVVSEHGTVEPNSGSYPAGTVVTLTATPEAGYYTVRQWSGTDDDTSCALTNTVTMDSDKTVTVEFGQRRSFFVPAEYESIQEAIDAAACGDVVILSAGVHLGNINFNGKNIIVSSVHPDDPDVVVSTIIQGSGTGSVVTFSGGESQSCVLDGLTITGGNTTGEGGGICGNGTEATISNCIIRDNHADGAGGGASNCNGTILRCIFSDNTTSGDGGAIYNLNGSPTVTNCTFSSNFAGGGGGAISSRGDPVLNNCVFIGNAAYGTGGGLYTWSGNPTLTDCNFTDNTAGWGGGLGNQHGNVVLTNCTFTSNVAESGNGGGMSSDGGQYSLTNCIFKNNSAARGGALWNIDCTVSGDYRPTITNCIFSDNSSGTSGGAIFNSFSSPELINCVVNGNSSVDGGGGIFNEDNSIPILINCTFSGNSASAGNGICASSGSDTTVENCILWDGGNEIDFELSSITVNNSDVQGGWPGEGNIDADPRFINPDSGDYHLCPNSPCIDTGDNTAVPPLVVTDLEGGPRITNGTVDMGAYEFQGIQTLYVDANAPAGGDGGSWATAYNFLQDALADANSSIKPVEIRVAEGIYKPDLGIGVTPGDRGATFQLVNGVTIKGGYAGFGEPEPDARNINLYETILSGDLDGNDIDVNDAWDVWREPSFVDNSYHVVIASGTNSAAVLDGFTVTGGCASGPDSYDSNDIFLSSGAGMYNDSGSPTVLNCTFRKNRTWTWYGQINGESGFDGGNLSSESTYIYLPETSGAAVFNRDGSPTFSNCLFEENVCFGADASSAGAGICNINSSPLLQNCVFRTNEVTGFDSECYGGAMANYISNPTLRDCLFVGNLAVFSFGGAIYNEESNPILENCTFRNNESSTSGGAIFVNGGNSNLTDCMFDENTAYMGGGMCLGDGLATLTNCTFTDNRASNGGGLYSDFHNRLTLKGCTFIGNRADGYGGAIENSGAWYNDPNSVTLIKDCVFTANSASTGGGVHNGWNRKNLTFVNSLFAGNAAAIAGGGMYNYGCEPILSNCTFTGNSAPEGNALASDLYFFQNPSILQITNCIFRDGENGILNNENSVVTITYSDVQGGWPGEGNIDADPCFVEPGYWDANGTPADVNDDFWVDGDYHLLFGSPCIDTGDPDFMAEPNETDLDGKPRVIGGRIDMGAYEFWGPVYVDDDAPNDPGPGDPAVSDPLENGTDAHPFDTIQEGINITKDGYTVLVRQGSYLEPASGNSIDYLGKNITLTSADPTDWDVVESTIIRGYVQFSGTEEPNCTFTGFRIHDIQYGAIYGNHTHATISHCNISGNGPCGATAIKDCDGTISNCLITDNMTVALCGIYPVVFGCNGLIKNCTIVNNVSGVSVGTATIENCIIYNNFGSQLAVTNGNTVNISYSNVQDGPAGVAGDGNVEWGPGNIDTDPCFVRLGYWVIDDATLIEGDYHLKSEGWCWNTEGKSWTYDFVTSRCADAGKPGSPLRDELLSVPRDPNNVWGVNLRINMGAYGGTSQASIPPHDWALLADLNNDGTVNFVDFAYQTQDWLTTAPEQPGDVNRDGVLNTMDLALLAEDWLKVTVWVE
jgi:predicted outer membrane repeat protein